MKKIRKKRISVKRDTITDLVINYIAKYRLDTCVENQTDLANDLKKEFHLTKAPNQGSISRAFKKLRAHSFTFDDDTVYELVKIDGAWQFKMKDNDMKKLYKFKTVFQQESVHKLSDNTLVFNVVADKEKVRGFIRAIKNHLPIDMLWGISHHDEHLFLMFNEDSKHFKFHYSLFSDFFKNRAMYLKERAEKRAKKDTEQTSEIALSS